MSKFLMCIQDLNNRSRKHKLEWVIKIQPKIYSSKIMVIKKAGAVECFHVKGLEPFLYKPDLGFNKLLSEGDKIMAYKDNNREFDFVPKMICN